MANSTFFGCKYAAAESATVMSASTVSTVTPLTTCVPKHGLRDPGHRRPIYEVAAHLVPVRPENGKAANPQHAQFGAHSLVNVTGSVTLPVVSPSERSNAFNAPPIDNVSAPFGEIQAGPARNPGVGLDRERTVVQQQPSVA